MSKSAIVTISLSTILFLVFGGIVYFFTGQKSRQTPLPSESPILTAEPIQQSPEPNPYKANFVLHITNSTSPVVLSFDIKEDPSVKGLAAFRARIKYDPNILNIRIADIKTLLPKPWSIVRKEILDEGVIGIEGIYLNNKLSEVNRNKQNIASLNFTSIQQKPSDIKIDLTKSVFNFIEKNTTVYPTTSSALTYEPIK